MIFTEQTNLNPMTLCGMAIKLDAIQVNEDSIDYTTNCCNCECEQCYPVWGGGEDWQNDKSTFAFIKTIPTDTFSFKLYKNGSLATTIIDNTYADLVTSYGSNPLQYSLVLDWDKIFLAYGYGTYVLKNNYTSVGVAKIYESQSFCLSQFDSCEANGWVKLDWNQSGNILSNNFKFCTPLFHSIKLKSELFIQTPKTVKDSYITSNNEVKTFKTEQINSYLLKSKLINENLLTLLNENLALAEIITVTDFNSMGTRLVKKEMNFLEFANLLDPSGIRKINLEVKFEDYKQDIEKNKCC